MTSRCPTPSSCPETSELASRCVRGVSQTACSCAPKLVWCVPRSLSTTRDLLTDTCACSFPLQAADSVHIRHDRPHQAHHLRSVLRWLCTCYRSDSLGLILRCVARLHSLLLCLLTWLLSACCFCGQHRRFRADLHVGACLSALLRSRGHVQRDVRLVRRLLPAREYSIRPSIELFGLACRCAEKQPRLLSVAALDRVWDSCGVCSVRFFLCNCPVLVHLLPCVSLAVSLSRCLAQITKTWNGACWYANYSGHAKPTSPYPYPAGAAGAWCGGERRLLIAYCFASLLRCL